MAKRGRKRKGYFYEEQEQAVKDYIASNDISEKNKIYDNILKPAFTKMVESLIRRYKLYLPDEEFDETFNDTMSFLMTKIHKYKETVFKYDELEDWDGGICFTNVDENFYLKNYKDTPSDSPEYITVTFNPITLDRFKKLFKKSDNDSLVRYYQKNEYHYKAYSYCGTICKNYLYYKLNQFNKLRDKEESYDTMFESIRENNRYCDTEFLATPDEDFLTKLIDGTCNQIRKIIKTEKDNGLTRDEERVGLAIINLFENWEHVFEDEEMGTNKMNKSMILLHIKNATQLTTTEIRKSMKKYKVAYYDMKKILLET